MHFSTLGRVSLSHFCSVEVHESHESAPIGPKSSRIVKVRACIVLTVSHRNSWHEVWPIRETPPLAHRAKLPGLVEFAGCRNGHNRHGAFWFGAKVISARSRIMQSHPWPNTTRPITALTKHQGDVVAFIRGTFSVSATIRSDVYITIMLWYSYLHRPGLRRQCRPAVINSRSAGWRRKGFISHYAYQLFSHCGRCMLISRYRVLFLFPSSTGLPE